MNRLCLFATCTIFLSTFTRSCTPSNKIPNTLNHKSKVTKKMIINFEEKYSALWKQKILTFGVSYSVMQLIVLARRSLVLNRNREVILILYIVENYGIFHHHNLTWSCHVWKPCWINSNLMEIKSGKSRNNQGCQKENVLIYKTDSD